MLAFVGLVFGGTMPAPDNPSTGIWIQQKGEIEPHNATEATLHYTLFNGYGDRVKALSYYYDGAGWLNLMRKDTLCTTGDGMKGADGIAHHPDGDLLIAAQGNYIQKVSKTAKKKGQKCMVKEAYGNSGFYHLMMDPNQKFLWAAGIPGNLYRFSTEKQSDGSNFGQQGYKVNLSHDSRDRIQENTVSTLIWWKDETGTRSETFFTWSNFMGGGCETDVKGKACDEALRKKYRAGAAFGHISKTTWTKVTKDNVGQIGGKVGDSVITAMKMHVLLDSLEGAHGGTFDPYSNTIFVFGGAKIVQIRPYIKNGEVAAEKVAEIDLREYFFQESEANLKPPRTPSQGDGNTGWESGFTASVGWRLDQGTVDGYGHLFVASNTGHLVFVDYAANPKRYINDNVLVHLQWIDNYLDDLAPLDGVGVVRQQAGGSEETVESSSAMSSPSIVYEESSSSKKGSSSSTGVASSGSKTSSSSGEGGSSPSSSGEGGSSPSSSGEGGSSPSSSGEGGSSPSSSGEGGSSPSSSGEGGSSPSSSGEGDSSPSSSNGGGFPGSSSGYNPGSSSANQGSGIDVDLGSSSSRSYSGFVDFDLSSSGGIQFYPTADKFDKGDSTVKTVDVLKPSDKKPGTPGTITIGDNVYEIVNTPSDLKLDLSYDSGIDSAQVGQVVGLVLSKDSIAKYLGTTSDKLTFVAMGDIDLIDPSAGQKGDTLDVAKNGDVPIWVTADKPVRGAQILVYDKVSGQSIIIDNINFFDPVPDGDSGYLKDTKNDDILDYMEIVLKDTLPEGMQISSVSIVPRKGASAVKVNSTAKVGSVQVSENEYSSKKVNTISMDVSSLKLTENKVDETAYAIITYKSASGTLYTRNVSLKTSVQIIKASYAIRNKSGKDSLFVEYNVNLSPVDLAAPELLVMLKQGAKQFGFVGQVSKVYMPTKNLIILVGDSLGLLGGMKDSVSLHPSVTSISGSNINYITSEEYDREVPVTVTDRLPAASNVEYWDTDGDGVLDRVVVNFSGKLTKADLEKLHMEFPWYSERGMQIQLQAQPSDLVLDSKNPTKVIWDVHSPTRLAKGVTSVNESLQASVYTYYPVLGHTFASEDNVSLVDKMSPLIASASLSYGKKADTLLVVFTEPIQYKNLNGRDFFSYIHGKDEIDLLPKDIVWSADGMTAKLILDGNISTILPGDSLRVVKGAHDNIRDNYGNIMGEKPQAVVITGLLNHLVESTKMGSFDANSDEIVHSDSSKDYTLQTVSSVNLRYVPSTTTKEDMEKEGALGQLIQLGERFVPQLLDRAQISADGSVDPSALDSLDPKNVYITFVVQYYDHLGQYVNDTTIMVSCTDYKFGGNCLNTDQKVFVNWNFKDHNGRFVGTGIYMVQFKMVVRYENKKIEEEIKDKWGVRRKKHRKKN